jgi:hypothetical protein
VEYYGNNTEGGKPKHLNKPRVDIGFSNINFKDNALEANLGICGQR